jgi:tRNA/tmRNA/rRNA uracil-C5-methylase (TrmA/RlmC/RlmD family)
MSLTVGDRATFTIEDIAFGGEGIGRIEDLVVFVPFVAPGEVVEAEVVEVKKRFARARLVHVNQSSEERVEPKCSYFRQCGGCQYQHLDYTAQLRIKHKQIGDLFERIGHLDRSLIAPVIPCPKPYGYRNRVMIRSQWDKFKHGLNIGYIRAGSRLVVDVERCEIAEEAINEQIVRSRAHPPPKGGLKVVLRIMPEGWEVPPDSFFQNNLFLLPELVRTVREMISSGGARHLLDLYCGVGFFAIETADLVQNFAAIELDALAVRAARKNAAVRAITNGEFVAASVDESLPAWLARFSSRQTTIILDPPRKGCPPGALGLLRQSRPQQLIYVSCYPATMARDLNTLCAEGVFKVVAVKPLDMFPQTAHVECVADIRLVG